MSSLPIFHVALPIGSVPVPTFFDLSAGSSVPVAISFAIAVMAVLALLCQLSLRHRYKQAGIRLAAIRDLLTGSVDLNTVKQACGQILDKELETPRTSLLAGYFNHAFRVKAEFQPVQAVEAVREREGLLARAAFVRWTMNTALIMGLAGTFFAFLQLISGSGMLEALASIRGTPGNGNPAEQTDAYGQLSTAFTHVYQGFGHAFLASLTGLLSTIGLGLFNTMSVVRCRDTCLADTEEFGEEVLRPLLAPAVNHAEELSAALRGAAGVLANSGQTVDALRETATLLSQASSRFEQSQGAQSEMVSTLTKLAQEIETSRGRWDVLLEALRESKRAMNESVEEFRKGASEQLRLTSVATANAVAEMRDLTRGFSAEIQKVTAAKTDHFHAVQSEVQRLVFESKKDWEKASEAVLTRTDEGFKASLAVVAQSLQDGRKDAEAARTELGEMAKLTARAVQDHQESLQGHTQAVTASLQAWADAPAQVAAAVRSGGDTLDRLAKSLSAVAEMPARWEKRVLTPLVQLGGKLDEANARGRVREDVRPFWSRWWGTRRHLGQNEGAPRP